METIKRELDDYRVLMRSIPGSVLSLFIVSIIVMNLLANKEFFSVKYLALDCGFTMSWVSFLCMDMICKHFGPKAAVKVSVTALLVNLAVCVLFKLISLTPGMWAEYYTTGMIEVNDALNATVGGNWFVVFGSSTAMLVSAICNAFLNSFVGEKTRNDNFRSFALRSYISTGVAQFVDNLVFALIVARTFFGWTMVQIFVCSLTGACVELLCEMLLGPVGYRVTRTWKRENVGKAYLQLHAKERIA